MLEDFKQFVIGRKVLDRRAVVDQGQGIHPRDDSLRDRCAVFSMAIAQQHLIEADPQAKFALTHVPGSRKLTELTRNRSTTGGR